MIKGTTLGFSKNQVPAPQKRRPHRAALFLGLCVLAFGLALASFLPGAWQATQRSEAYLPQLEAQARRHSDDGPLLALLGGRLMEAGEYPAATAALKQAIAAGEQPEIVWQALAASNAAVGQTSPAIADLKLGIKSLGTAPILQTALTQALARDASPDDMARAINPQGPGPLVTVYTRGSVLNGIMAWWGRRHPAASGFATREAWAEAQPRNAEAQRLWGLALQENRRLPEAEAALQGAVTLAPQSPDCHLALADLLRRESRLQAAAQEYIAALRLRPRWTPALLGFGAAFQASHLPTYAFAAYKRATEVAPGSAEAWIGLGSVLNQKDGKAVETIAAFQKAAQLAPDRTDFFDSYADALRSLNQQAQAEVLLRRRLVAAPEDAFAHYELGAVLTVNDPTPDRVREAEAQTLEALRLSPHNPVADVQLAGLRLQQGRAAEAASLLTDSLKRVPDNPQGLLLLARAYRRMGRDGPAARVAQQAGVLANDQEQSNVLENKLVEHPSDIHLHQQLAVLYDRLNEPDKAAKQRAAILQIRTGGQSDPKGLREFQASIDAVLPAH